MSSSTTNKLNSKSKEKNSVIKLPKSNQLSNDTQALKTSLKEVIADCDPKIKIIHQDSISSKPKLSKEDERVHCPVIIIFLESVQKPIMKTLIWKHFVLNGRALKIMLSFCEKYVSLNNLRFEDANFQEDDIELLALFLNANPNVCDLYLCGSPCNKSFKCLIHNCKLKYLTLKFCGMDHNDLEDFIKPLENTYGDTLLHLNLSNNNIGDEGAKILARVLRVNRILVSLNVSANGITDEGARDLLRALQMFELNQDEISIRRKIYYRYYLMKYEEVAVSSRTPNETEKNFVSGSSSTSFSKLKTKTKSKTRGSKTSKSAPSISELSVSSAKDNTAASARSHSVVLSPPDTLEMLTTLDLASAHHPFVKDTNVDGYQFICKGNFMLNHLNLSSNKLTSDILKDIHAVLDYQEFNKCTDEGLKSISVHGNDIKSEDNEDPQDVPADKRSRTLSSGVLMAKETPKRSRKTSK